MIEQSSPFLKKSDFDYVDEILKSAQVARGRLVEKLQKEFCGTLNLQYSCATSSGTGALHLILLALGIGEKDEVIIPSYTCTALLNAVNYVAANAVIVDIDPETLNITPDIIKRHITSKTKAIILTHTFGFPADIDRILELGIPVIEDCAHALGSAYKERPTGSLGVASTFSMYATKMIAAGEGGMVCTNNEKLAGTIRDLNNPDMREFYRVRYNYKMSDLTAGLVLNQLKKLDFFVARRRSIAEEYKKSFSSLPIKFQRALPETAPSYYRFVICTPKADQLISFAQTQGVIFDRPVYKPLHRYLNIKNESSFPGTELAWNRAVSIPIYPALKNDKVSSIITAFLKAFE